MASPSDSTAKPSPPQSQNFVSLIPVQGTGASACRGQSAPPRQTTALHSRAFGVFPILCHAQHLLHRTTLHPAKDRDKCSLPSVPIDARIDYCRAASSGYEQEAEHTYFKFKSTSLLHSWFRGTSSRQSGTIKSPQPPWAGKSLSRSSN